MQCLPVIILLVSSVYSSDEVFNAEPSDDDQITTRANYVMIGNISNKGRRYNPEDTTDINEEVNQEDEIEEASPIPFSRNVRSFDFYDDLYDNYRRKNMKENKNADPRNILNDIRSRNSQSNAYNEDQQRRMFFSHIFSLFDDDKNTRRSGKSNDKSKHSKSHIDHDVETFKSPRSRTEQPTYANKHEPHRKISLKNKDIEPEYDSFESTIESFLNGKYLSNNQYDDDNEGKHKRKNKGRRQASRNNSRPERQLGDSDSYEIVENENQDVNDIVQEFIPHSKITNRKRKNTNNDEIVDTQSSSPVTEIDNDNESLETAYLVRTPSFNYYQAESTYAIPDTEISIQNEGSTEQINIEASADNKDGDSVVLKVRDGKYDNTESEDKEQESVYFNPDVQSTTIDDQSVESVSQKESIDIVKDNTNGRELMNVVVEELMSNQTEVSNIKTPNDLVGKDTRRMNYVSVDDEEYKANDQSNVKEQIETSGKELQVSKVYGEADIPGKIRNPLSARIKLDLLIQLPSQVDVENEI